MSREIGSREIGNGEGQGRLGPHPPAPSPTVGWERGSCVLLGNGGAGAGQSSTPLLWGCPHPRPLPRWGRVDGSLPQRAQGIIASPKTSAVFAILATLRLRSLRLCPRCAFRLALTPRPPLPPLGGRGGAAALPAQTLPQPNTMIAPLPLARERGGGEGKPGHFNTINRICTPWGEGR